MVALEKKMIVKSVEFVLENCEVITVEYPDICFLRIGKVKEKFSTFCNAISKMKFTNKFEVIIHQDAKISTDGMFDTDKCPRKRLKLGDITGLKVNYDNGDHDFFGIKWPKGDETYHSHHKNVELDNGALYMCCSYKKNMKMMNKEEIKMCTDMIVRNN